MPGGGPASTSASSPAARSLDQVGEPRWSSTTSTVSRVDSSRAMVRTKLLPLAPYTQAVRTTQDRSGSSSRTARSPASLVRPYADRGPTGASTWYGLPASPAKT